MRQEPPSRTDSRLSRPSHTARILRNKKSEYKKFLAPAARRENAENSFVKMFAQEVKSMGVVTLVLKFGYRQPAAAAMPYQPHWPHQSSSFNACQ